MNPPEILIVEDSAIVAMSLADVLDVAGFRSTIAASGRKALELLQEREFSLAYLDFRLPDMTGLELHRRARELQPTLTTHVMTGYTLEHLLTFVAPGQSTAVVERPPTAEQAATLIGSRKPDTIMVVCVREPDFPQAVAAALAARGVRAFIPEADPGTGTPAFSPDTRPEVLVLRPAPVLDAMSLCMDLRASGLSAPILVVLDPGEGSTPERVLNSGAASFNCYFKPVDPEQVIRHAQEHFSAQSE
ncbi:MAG: response regulator [Gemmatimonadota bacterium]|nr:response regulator [Gemmatimonadota bacterium]